jgi:hypothetical protein
MAKTIIGETKKEGQRKAKRRKTCKNQKKRKGRKLVFLMVGSYFTHYPSNVACMQIVKSNSNGRFKTSITLQHNLPLYNRG